MGMVPWFSGTAASQTFQMLEESLLFAVITHTNSPWLVFKNTRDVHGANADLNFFGYVEIAFQKDQKEMEIFVRRLIDKMGVKIVNEGGFQGMVKYYSGIDNVQDFEKLVQEIRSAPHAPRSWAAWKTALLEIKSRKVSSGSSGLGNTASLDELGYQSVVDLKDDAQMGDFIRRLIEQLDCKIEDEGGFKGMIPYFSGTRDKQSFEKLRDTLSQAFLVHGGSTWLSYRNESGITGDNASLDQVGYMKVAAQRNDEQMRKFVQRLLTQLGVKVIDESGLEGMLHHYSGVDDFQDYSKLLQEVRSAAAQSGTWAEWTA